MNACVNGWLDVLMDGWMDGLTCVWMNDTFILCKNGRMNGCVWLLDGCVN